ncbi:MAG: metal ABC transporter permease [Bacteroidota bacterium]|nr:metal ABC transporter permease [Bacteroidota bacterium]
MSLFHYQFFLNAFLSALLASIACGFIGTYIVTRRIVFISGGITHSSFGGIGISYFMGFNPVLGAAIFSILSALGIEFISKRTEVREDSAIGILWSLGMALGIIFIFLTPGYAPNLMTYLFGSILTVNTVDLILMAINTLLIIAFFFIFYRLILYIAFDEEFARAYKAPVSLINNLLLIMVALTIVLSIRVVGIILVISFLTLPQTTANIFTKDFKKMIGLSVLIGCFGSFAGLLVSYYYNIPSGASIIFSFAIIFILVRGGKEIWLRTNITKQKSLTN